MRKYFLFLAVLIFISSCKHDPLDLTPDGRISLDDVFSDEVRTEAYLNTTYDFLQAYGIAYYYFVFLASLTDDAHDNDAPTENLLASEWYNGSLTPSHNPLSVDNSIWNGNYYSENWKGIRTCNVFLKNIKDKNYPHVNQWIAEAKVMRAFYYWELVKMYGPMPIMEDEFPLDFDFGTIERPSFDEVVQFILRDCREAVAEPTLPFRNAVEQDRARMTKAVAYAIASEASLFNASPLWNPTEDNGKWQQAAQVSEDALNNLVHNNFELFPDYSVYFENAPDVGLSPLDKETLLQIKSTRATNFADLEGLLLLNLVNGIPSIGSIMAGCSPSQELVDSYEMNNGELPILGYQDADHLIPIINSASGYDDGNPYVNRDPRFYSTIFYNGAFYSNFNGAPHFLETYQGGADEISATDRTHTHTGYYLHKFINPSVGSVWQVGNTTWRRFRLAEVYLNLAEAANEANNGPNSVAYNAINTVRRRAGLPDLQSGLNKEEFRKRVRNERRVEFAIEENRFWDIRRWKILDKVGKSVSGMQWIKNTDDTYTNERFVVGRRNSWDDKYLIFPIPSSELANLGSFKQNPGW